MAIVKFISDKNCQLFIDMELIGEVQTDKMLKVLLDAGSYLVEAKGPDGNCLKRFKLKINTAKGQILQDLAISNATINETIKKLRNDSSLRFYNQRAIFCHDGCYGYINTQYKIAISPIYSYAENFVSTKTFVKRQFPDGEKATIIDVDGNICLDQWYDYIGCNDKTILLKSENVFYVLSRDNYSFIEEYQDAMYDGKADLIPVHKEFGVDDMYGFIDKTGTIVIPFIYDYVWNFEKNGYARVKRFGNYIIVDKKGTLYLDEYVATHPEKQVHYNDIHEYDSIVNILSKEESINRSLSPDDCYSYYPIKEDGYWGLGDIYLVDKEKEYFKDTNKIKYFKCDRIITYVNYIDKILLIYRKKGICTMIYNFKGGGIDGILDGEHFSIEADEIHPVLSGVEDDYYPLEKELKYVIIKRNRKYGITNLQGTIILPIEYDLIVATYGTRNFRYGDIVILWKGDKCTLYSISRRKNMFDDCVFLNFTNNNDIENVAVMQGNKWAILNINIENDRIVYDLDNLDFKYSSLLEIQKYIDN